MADQLRGKTIAILAADGFEQVELEKPQQAVEAAGAKTVVVSIDKGEIQGMNGDVNLGDKIAVDKTVDEVSPSDFAGLIMPGGIINPDKLRMEESVITFLQEYFKTGKPVGVICHGPWTLIEADLVKGRRMTAWPTVRTDLKNAGAEVVDEEVVTDQGLVSSRNPDDLPAFCAKIVEEFAEGEHHVAPEGATA